MGIVTNVTFQLGHFLAEMDRKELELEGGDAEFAFQSGHFLAEMDRLRQRRI